MSKISIVIPAHNEADVIERCLASLDDAAAPGEMEIVVVCNGCSDNTAERARRGGRKHVRVIETPIPSKTQALNLGDATLGDEGFPRFYVDADVVLSGSAVREVIRAMEQNPAVLAAAPVMEFDLAGCPWLVRAFYEVWSALPFLRHGNIGGAYALSEEGRRRFDRFPGIIADDAFVRLHFKPSERLTVQTCCVTVFPPRTFWGLIKISTRACFGDYELRAKYPELLTNKQDGHGKALPRLLMEPKWWPKVPVYLAVRVISRLLAYRRFYFGNHGKWDRDSTSRTADVSTSVRFANTVVRHNSLSPVLRGEGWGEGP